MSNIPENIIAGIIACCENSERLKALTSRQLVAECLSCPAADYDVVVEMMNRLDPGWEDEMRIAE